MDRETFERAAEIFVNAADVDPKQQSVFIEQSCAGDANLLREVYSLIDAVQGADEFFDDLAARLGVSPSGRHDDDRTRTDPTVGRQGMIIGAYTLTEKVGSGGAGTVWRAERTDGQFEGHVAIKIVDPAATPLAAANRLSDEAQHLAKLSHPNIARLLDAGVDEEGHPYLVLQFINGTPIDLYCNTNYLIIEKRIELFIEVARAVAHAHAHLIVHRDIKPSNVLVDENGDVKLLDFGIAKLLRVETELPSAGSTVEVGAALTPEYAAPEQLLGHAITTATDVYALGLMLYEMLAGRSPRSAHTIDTFAALVEAATQDPPKASTQASHAERRGLSLDSLQRTLHGDLDNVLQKALAPEPEDRYTTATELASDLQRYLKGETVSAMPPTLVYRTRKFIGRHRGGVATTLLTAIALVMALAIATTQMFEARKQRNFAIYQQQRAQISNDFLSLLRGRLGPGGRSFTLNELLTTGVAMLESQHGIKPEYVGWMYYELADGYFNISETLRGTELLEQATNAARKSGDGELLTISLCRRARLEFARGPDRARKFLTEANNWLAEARNLSTDTIATCARANALQLQSQGEDEKAFELLIAARERLRNAPVKSVEEELTLLNELSNHYFKNGRYAECTDINNEILVTMEQTGRGDTSGYFVVATNRAILFEIMGEHSHSHQLKNSLLERTGGDMTNVRSARTGSMGMTLFLVGRHDEALEVLYETLQTAEREGATSRIAKMQAGIGRVLADLGRMDESAAMLDLAQEHFVTAPEHNLRNLQSIDRTRAVIAIGVGDLPRARRLMADQLEELGYPQIRLTPHLHRSLEIASHIALSEGDASLALAYATDSLEIARRIARDPEQSSHVGRALWRLAEAQQVQGDTETATEHARLAIVSLTNGITSEHPDTIAAKQLWERLEYDTTH